MNSADILRPLPLIAGLALASLGFDTGPAEAWGIEGHRIALAIAERHSTREAAEAVREIIGDLDLSSEEVARWADEMVLTEPESRPWHYVNIPLQVNPRYRRKRDCPGDECGTGRRPSARMIGDDPVPTPSTMDGPGRGLRPGR